ncbi:hypothetical protein CEXT_788761 [Caerostris extrusa]|uniref:Uncharacterized protein n=1 Tax=Caerostris extrusa TaxID=172846 RepID=A0AAV4XSX9_CAEEX|nr:hypothetical protein CEXT_788761 [Caerostris extrusa]
MGVTRTLSWVPKQCPFSGITSLFNSLDEQKQMDCQQGFIKVLKGKGKVFCQRFCPTEKDMDGKKRRKEKKKKGRWKGEGKSLRATISHGRKKRTRANGVCSTRGRAPPGSGLGSHSLALMDPCSQPHYSRPVVGWGRGHSGWIE